KEVFEETALHRHLAAQGAPAREEEERRVLFVAMTRAKNLLLLSGAGNSAFLDRVSACLPETTDPHEPAPLEAAVAPEAPAAPLALEEALAAALERIAAPEPTPEAAAAGPRGVHLSFSHVSLYDTCPLKYKFTFVTPLPGMGHGSSLRRAAEAGAATDLAANELGTVFHEALERWAHEDRPLDELVREAA